MANTNSTWILQALDQHEAALLRYCTRLLSDPEAARDVVQEAFLELCKVKPSSVEDHLAPWLFRVCRNRVLDLRRKDKRMQALSEEHGNSIESAAPSPLAALQENQGAQTLLSMVKKLPDTQQEVVYLRFHAGLSYKEIAEVTGHSVSNVGVLIHNAVRSIRDRIAQSGHAADALKGAL